jgi:putative ABC transport system substrate-binding protein
MNRFSICCVLVLIVIGIAFPCFAQDKNYRVEVLQVTNNGPFEYCLNGFLKELESNGIVQGRNLTINRRIIDFDVEKGGLWKKVGVLLRIKKEASLIVKENPDLVLTIGTPATRYAKDKIIAAGIPLVFTAVAIPEAAGCESLTVAGQGFTGATLYMDINNFLQITRLAFPQKKTFGIIHTDDDNSLAQVEQVKEAGGPVGMTFITKEVNKKDSIIPAAKELIEQGAEAFLLPMDTYYGMRNNEPCSELSDVTLAPKIPAVSMMYFKIPGATLYVGSDFSNIGTLSGQNAVKILKEGASPDELPILRQDDLSIMVDVDRMKALQIQLPMEILQLAKAVK